MIREFDCKDLGFKGFRTIIIKSALGLFEGKSKRFQNKVADKIRFSFLESLRINT